MAKTKAWSPDWAGIVGHESSCQAGARANAGVAGGGSSRRGAPQAIAAKDVDRADRLAHDHTRQFRDSFIDFMKEN